MQFFKRGVIALIPVIALGACTTLSDQDRALLAAASQNAEQAKTLAQQALEDARAARRPRTTRRRRPRRRATRPTACSGARSASGRRSRNGRGDGGLIAGAACGAAGRAARRGLG